MVGEWYMDSKLHEHQLHISNSQSVNFARIFFTQTPVIIKSKCGKSHHFGNIVNISIILIVFSKCVIRLVSRSFSVLCLLNISEFEAVLLNLFLLQVRVCDIYRQR